jgi:hypothetical protein
MSYDVTKKREYAEACREKFETQKRSKTIVNICEGRANWDACDFRDFGFDETCEHGIMCWQQSKPHSCIKCKTIRL